MFLLAVGMAFSPMALDAVSDARQAAGLDTIRVRQIIIIQGNAVTADRVLRNQLPFKPGQRLRYAKLEEGRVNLIRTGLFDEDYPVTVDVVSTGVDDPYRDVRVRVMETRTGSIGRGADVNSNAGLNHKPTVTTK